MTVVWVVTAFAPLNALLLVLLLELSFDGCEGGVGGLGAAGTPTAGTPTGSECCGWLLCWTGCDTCAFVTLSRTTGFAVPFTTSDNLLSNTSLLEEDEEFWKKVKTRKWFQLVKQESVGYLRGIWQKNTGNCNFNSRKNKTVTCSLYILLALGLAMEGMSLFLDQTESQQQTSPWKAAVSAIASRKNLQSIHTHIPIFLEILQLLCSY
jgi:hypothetical protein